MHPINYFIFFSLKNIHSNRYTHRTTTQAGCITIPPHYLKIIPYMFEHEFLPLIIHSDFSTYDNVFQNVRTYSGNESIDARRIFCKWEQINLNTFQHKRKKPPPPIEKNAPKNE